MNFEPAREVVTTSKVEIKWWQKPFPGEILNSSGQSLPEIPAPEKASLRPDDSIAYTLITSPETDGKIRVLAACFTGAMLSDREVGYDQEKFFGDVQVEMTRRGLDKDFGLQEEVFIKSEEEKKLKGVTIEIEQLTGGNTSVNYIKN